MGKRVPEIAGGGGGGNGVGGVPIGVWIAGAGVLFLAPAIGYALAGGLPRGWMEASSERGKALTQVLAYLGAIATGWAVLWLLAPRLGPRVRATPRLGDAPRALLGLALTAPVYVAAASGAALVYTLLSGVEPEPLAHEALPAIVRNIDNPWTWVRIFAVVVCAPVYEELLYRVFVQSALLRLTTTFFGERGVWCAIVATSILFALMHVIGGGPVPWHAVPGLFVLSLGLGIAYEKTGRMGVPMLMHALFNAANIALAVLL